MSIQVDETTDVSTKELLSAIIRVDMEAGVKLLRDFLNFLKSALTELLL